MSNGGKVKIKFPETKEKPLEALCQKTGRTSVEINDAALRLYFDLHQVHDSGKTFLTKDIDGTIEPLKIF